MHQTKKRNIRILTYIHYLSHWLQPLKSFILYMKFLRARVMTWPRSSLSLLPGSYILSNDTSLISLILLLLYEQRRGTQLVVFEGRQRNVWENTWSDSCLDLHLMSSGAAQAMVHAWLLNIRSIVSEDRELPDLLRYAHLGKNPNSQLILRQQQKKS